MIDRLASALAGRSDIRVALLFGSQARGTAGARSDVDVAVLAPGVDLLDVAAELSIALGEEIDVISLESIDIPLARQLIDQAVPVHEARPGCYAGWRSRTLAMLEIDGPWYERMRDAWINRVAERGL